MIAQGTASWAAIALNPFDGSLLSTSTTNGAIIHSTRLPYHLANGLSPLLIVDSALKAHIYPSTDEALSLVARRSSDLYFHLLDSTTKVLRGYSFSQQTRDGHMKLFGMERWSIVLPMESNAVRPAPYLPSAPASSALASSLLTQVTIAHFPHDAAVHSPVRVLGDRSVLYKYVNRNALAIGVAVPELDGEDPSIQARARQQ